MSNIQAFNFRFGRLLQIGLVVLLVVAVPANGQQTGPPLSAARTMDSSGASNRKAPAVLFSTTLDSFVPTHLQSFGRTLQPALLPAKPLQTPAPGTIGKMEAAFSCNDTPFIDQVRLPVAALWRGRVRLTGFESDVTTANFILGLPGAGTQQSLSMTGSGHLATHAPPSDQLFGLHLTFYLDGREIATQDNSGLLGMQYLVRSGRNFLQTFLAR